MKVLYCALGIDVTGAHGGATHASEVANGLHALGHAVRLIGGGQPRAHGNARVAVPLTLTPAPPPLAWMMTPRVRQVVSTWQPDVVMERYYTFAGGGIVAAHARGIPSVLEVNAPVVDPPGTKKDLLDRATGRIMTRWAKTQCAWADRIVTPLATTVPPAYREKVERLQWGANIGRFDPARFPRSDNGLRALRQRYGITDDAPVVGFVGSFRAWHGAASAVRAFARVLAAIPNARFLLVGDGPERRGLMDEAAQIAPAAFIFAGAVPYEAVPAHLALCDIAVAPFAPRLHPPLQHFGFYWSPLKVWEAMAMALPVVTTAVAPLDEMIEGCGACVPEGDDAALADAMIGLLRDPARRATMGARGRQRVVEQWSWEAHCRHLDRILRELVSGR